MKQIDDDWMRPRTKAGTEEMRRRLNSMREILQAAAKTESIESKFNLALFNEYFSFNWDSNHYTADSPWENETEVDA
jgi:hypothetical protein